MFNSRLVILILVFALSIFIGSGIAFGSELGVSGVPMGQEVAGTPAQEVLEKSNLGDSSNVDQQPNLLSEREANRNLRISRFAECQKLNPHQLSEVSRVIVYFNQFIAKKQVVVSSDIEDSKTVNPENSIQVNQIKNQIKVANSALIELFEKYKKVGGNENLAENVKELEDPCDQLLEEIKYPHEKQEKKSFYDPTLITRARVLIDSCKLPDYPRISIYNEEEGTVRLALLIDVDGRVSVSFVEKSSKSLLLDMYANEAFKKCRFEPNKYNGKPQVAWTVIEYVYKLPRD
jgi:TonB family protein